MTKAIEKEPDYVVRNDRKFGRFSRRRSKFEAILLLAIFLLLVLSVGLFAGLLYSVLTSRNIELCTTPECTIASATLLKSMDQTKDPCNDFYGFACGGWLKEHAIPDDAHSLTIFEELDTNIQRRVKELLEDAAIDKPLAVMKAQGMYEACMNETAIDQRGITPLLEYLNSLGGWPLGDPTWNEDSVDIVKLIATLARHGFEKTILQLGVVIDMKNTSRFRISIDQPSDYELRRNIRRRRDTEFSGILDPSVSLLKEMAILFGQNNMTQVEKDIEEMELMESIISAISTPKQERRNHTRQYNVFTVDQLHKLTGNKFDWHRLARLIFDNITEISRKEPVIVGEIKYLKEIPMLIGNFSKRAIANFVLWTVVSDLAPHVSEEMRDLLFNYEKIMRGVVHPKPRWQFCVSTVNQEFGYSLGRLFVKEKFKSSSKEVAEEFIDVIQKAFTSIIHDSDWMDDATKKVAKEKVETMRKFIGYPDWILDDKKINDYYKNHKITEVHFSNVIDANMVHTNRVLSKLRESVDKNEWFDMSVEVNAFYDASSNAITFPASILQMPFFLAGRPAAMNFGAIGTIIGHEIGHGLDDEGSQFDKDGNLRRWWDESAIYSFYSKTKCFINQYSKYCPSELMDGDNVTCVDGVSTLGENIADNSGLACALKAYHFWVDEHGEEKRLPGLEQYTPTQLFFLSFGLNWCELSRLEHLQNQIETDSHSPPKYRVEGALSNLKEFSDAFGCTKGKLNRKHQRCSLW